MVSIQDKQRVLLAEDDPSICDLLKMMFEERFDMTIVHDGIAAQKLIFEKPYDFILLDIRLPGRDGLSLCRLISEANLFPDLPVIILSADDNKETIKRCYEFGVTDYVCKPFNVIAFHGHILRFSQDLQRIRQLEEHDLQVQSIADAAMKQSAFLGQGIELLSRLNQCQSTKQVAELTMQSLKQLGVSVAIQFRLNGKLSQYDADIGECSLVEIQIFELLKSQGRIYHFGRRCMFNDRHVSVLVKLMPSKGSNSYDVMLDYVAKLLPAIEARLVSIQDQQTLTGTKQKLTRILEEVTKGIGSIDIEVRSVIDEVERKITESFNRLELQEHQEQFFMELVDKELRNKIKSSKYIQLQDMMIECVNAIDVSAKAEGEKQSLAVNADDIELF